MNYSFYKYGWMSLVESGTSRQKTAKTNNDNS